MRIGQFSQGAHGKVSAKDIEALRRMNQENFEQVERVSQTQEVSQQNVRRQQAKIDSLEREIAYLRQMAAIAQTELKSIHEAQQVAADTLQPDSTPNDAYYVIVGYYLLRSYAEHYRQLLQSSIQLETEILELNNAYYVYTKMVHNQAEVQQEYRRLRRYNISNYAYGNIWALKKTTP
jgi:cell division septum initiation protein DivIVA